MVTPLQQVARAYERLETATRKQQAMRQALRETIHEARKKHTLAEIGEVLGITRQGVHDLLKRP